MAETRVLLQIEIQPGREPEFEQLWREHSTHISELPDNRGQWLLRRTDRENGYVVITDWTSEAAFRAFERTELQQAYLAKLWPMRIAGSMAVLSPVYALPAASAAAA